MSHASDWNSQLYRKAAVDALSGSAQSRVVLNQPRSIAFFVVASVLAAVSLVALFFFGTYTHRSTVSGYVTPVAGMVRVYTPIQGIVVESFVRQGQVVKKGDVLMNVSADLSVSSLGQTQAGITRELRNRRSNLQAEIERTRSLYVAQTESLRKSIDVGMEELRELGIAVTEQKKRAETLAQIYERHEKLRAEGYISEDAVLSRKEQLGEQLTDLAQIQRNHTALRRQLDEQRSQLRETPILERNAIASLERQVSTIDQELQESEARRTVAVQATQDGKVAVVSREVGQQVQPGLPVAIILPEGGALEVQLYAPSRAIAFVKNGDEVWLRFPAYPFQKFGQYRGKVKSVSASALSAQDLEGIAPFTPAQQVEEPMYRVIVELTRQTVTAYGREQLLLPGMHVEADLGRDTRRLYEWTFEPLFTLAR